MADKVDTSKWPGFHILISLIEIWDTPSDKSNLLEPPSSGVTRITEVEDISIVESYKQLIGTATVKFPRGTVYRRTISPEDQDETNDYKILHAEVSSSGVINETRTGVTSETSVVTATTFKVGQRIRIRLGYTTDPKVADSAKLSNVSTNAQTIFNDKATLEDYISATESYLIDGTTYTNIMFDGYITKIGVDTPVILECENLASALKTVTCPKLSYKKCDVKMLMGDDAEHNLLENTGLILHPNTAKLTFNLGKIDLVPDLTVADVLTEWKKFGLYAYVCTYNGQPAIQIGRPYFSNIGKGDSLLEAETCPNTPIDIYFDYHVAENGLTVTETKREFLCVEAQGVDKDDKFIHITIAKNDAYDDSKPMSESNAPYRHFNESTLSKKAIKAGKRYITSCPKDKLDMKLYNKISFISRTIPVTKEKLIEEAIEYMEGYNCNGIEGQLTLFGDLHLRTAQQVRLIDYRYPGKNGIYIVEEVNTNFGTGGYRQTIKLPYCIQRDGSE